MNSPTKAILCIPETVREDTLNYRGQVERFLKAETSPVSFRAYRVPMGVYEQRTSGKFMIRVRIGAGLVLPSQLQCLAELSRTYGNGVLHVTTRQDIQIHEVNIEDTPDVLEKLLEVGLSSRGGGGNTVRNITACPETGVCPDEVYDVAPYALAAAEYLLQDRSSFNLPRKYKIVFSGCPQDCAYASVADLGFFAHIKDGVKGFAVYAAGGLGSNPAVAVKIEEFIKAEEIFVVAEAIKQLFDKHGDRANKHKARLRYVLARMGVDEFLHLYRQEKDHLSSEGLPNRAPVIRDVMQDYPVADDSVTIRLWLENGDIPADDLERVGQIACRWGQGLVRTTQLQDLVITGVAADNTDSVNNELKDLGIDVFGNGHPKVVACAGASTCKLGLCLSKGLSKAISDKLTATELPDTVIRISGCPNSCGHHYIADIGFQGRAKRINDRLIPCYDVLVGAKIHEGQASLAERVGTVPAKQIPGLLNEVAGDRSIDDIRLRDLTNLYSKIDDSLLSEDAFCDWGSDEAFSLAGRGPGECGAGVMDVIKLDIEEAKDAIGTKPATDQTVYKAVVAAARALLYKVGLEPKKEREIFKGFSEHLILPGWVKPQTQQLLDHVIDWKIGDRGTIKDLSVQAEDLVDRVEELFLSLDASLNFKAKPIADKTDIEETASQNHVVDLRGVACPMNFVKAKLELEKLEIGDILEVLLDDGEPVRNAPDSFAQQGQDILDIKKIEDYFSVKVKRKK
jgi:sulfite reductase (ferredoxin)